MIRDQGGATLTLTVGRVHLRPGGRSSAGAAGRALPRHGRRRRHPHLRRRHLRRPDLLGRHHARAARRRAVPGWPTSGIATPITIFTIQPQTHILLVDSILAGDSTATTDVLKHHVLPCFTLGLLLCGVIIRLVRVNVIQAMKGDYVEAARARGISERNVVRRHAFRNALVPVITVIGLLVALTLGGAVLTERTFNWPGIGTELDPVPQRPRLHRRAGPGHLLRRGGGAVQPGGGHHQRAGRPEGEVLTCASSSSRSGTPRAWPDGSSSSEWSSRSCSWWPPSSRRGSPRSTTTRPATRPG